MKSKVKPLDTSKVWVVIAAYNEAPVIAETIAQILLCLGNVVVVDDCSEDATAENAMAAGARVLRHPINLGQGAALQTGIEYALKNNSEFIVTFDADGQHDANEIIPMLRVLQESQSDLVLGSRFLGSTSNLPWQRRLILKLAIVYTRVICGIKLTDVHNGFRAMTRGFCEKFAFRQNRMAHASEILTYIATHNIKYIECPVTITYTKYSIHKGQKDSNAFRVLIELLTSHISK
jgi:glycosyltransferase involved in cell wall biosynthesis